MSNPYLMHAWTNKAKESEYNRRYYQQHRDEILRKRRMEGGGNTTYNQQTYNAPTNTRMDRYSNEISTNLRAYDDANRIHTRANELNSTYTNEYNVAKGNADLLKDKTYAENSAKYWRDQATDAQNRVNSTRKIADGSKRAMDYAERTVNENRANLRKADVALGQAQNAYSAQRIGQERAANRAAVYNNRVNVSNAQAEAARRRNEATASKNAKQSVAKGYAANAASAAARASIKYNQNKLNPFQEKAQILKNKAKAALKKAQNAYRKTRDRAAKAAYERAQELYNKAKDKVSKFGGR